MTRQPFDRAWSASVGIDGWLHESQARLLYEAASAVSTPNRIVEIGSHRGKSTVILASAKQPDVPLLAVDPFDDPRWGGGAGSLKFFLENLERAGVRNNIDLYRGLSSEAAAEWPHGPTVGLLWVDGAHDRRSVLADFDGWLPHMAPKGLIYVHDSFSAIGTTEAVMQRLFVNPHVRYIGADRSLTMYRYESMDLQDRVISSARMAGRAPFFIKMAASKVGQRKGWRWLPQAVGYTADEGWY